MSNTVISPSHSVTPLMTITNNWSTPAELMKEAQRIARDLRPLPDESKERFLLDLRNSEEVLYALVLYADKKLGLAENGITDPATQVAIDNAGNPEGFSLTHYVQDGEVFVCVDSNDLLALQGLGAKQVAYGHRLALGMGAAGIDYASAPMALDLLKGDGIQPPSKLPGKVYRAIFKLTMPV